MNDFSPERLIQAWNDRYRDFVESVVLQTPPNERRKWRAPFVRAAMALDGGDVRTAPRRFWERMKALASHIHTQFIDTNTLDGALMAAIVVMGKVPGRSTITGDLVDV
ncbi:MAG: hypothetical protein DI536_14120 [Archangium gephyra]|uniref:Uncharacterized protein n=1 Tax=Archangium gephyra TaxID=48 RepID=A0A2W5TB40_9BACT|nr:MAG: hypothetical protein DI536_14120 [Archangium gephyra]